MVDQRRFPAVIRHAEVFDGFFLRYLSRQIRCRTSWLSDHPQKEAISVVADRADYLPRRFERSIIPTRQDDSLSLRSDNPSHALNFSPPSEQQRVVLSYSR